MSAIATDAALNDGIESDAVDAFFKKLVPTDAEKKTDQPSDKEETSTGEQPDKTKSEPATETETEADTSAEKPEGEAEDAEAEETEAERKLADDGAYVKVKVGDEEHEVPIKELSRLYGQEQSLTQKSMQVAEQRKTVDAELAKTVAASTALLERAKQRWEPYSKVDFLLAAKDLTSEEYTSLKQAATAAWEDVQFLTNNVNNFVQAAQQRQHTALIEQAKETLKTLSGPVEQGGIEGWNEKLYSEVAAFGIQAGLKKEIVDNLVDAAAIRLLHDAMLFRRGQSKVVVTRKVNKTPTKVIKTTKAPEAGSVNDKSKENAAAKKLRASGSTDDAADVFLARWANRDAEAN